MKHAPKFGCIYLWKQKEKVGVEYKVGVRLTAKLEEVRELLGDKVVEYDFSLLSQIGHVYRIGQKGNWKTDIGTYS